MSKKRKNRYSDSMNSTKKTVGYGYVGRWSDGDLGWLLPKHLCGSKYSAEPLAEHARGYANSNDFFTLCRITVEAVPGVRRRRCRK